MDKQDFLIGVGKRLRKARKERGWTQSEFAKMLGVSQSALCGVEKGHHAVNLHKFYKACRLLKICANSVTGRKRKAKGR